MGIHYKILVSIASLTSVSYQKLFLSLEEGTVLVTANQRLANYLHSCYDEFQVNRSKLAWDTPAIVSLNTWLQEQHNQLSTQSHFLLSDFQEQLIWQEIIQTNNPLLGGQITNTALLAKQAWETLWRWQIPSSELDYDLNDQVRTFLEWLTLFKQRLQEKNYISLPELFQYLQQKMLTQTEVSYPPMVFIGFDEFFPALEKLLQTLQRKTSITFWQSSQQVHSIQRTLAHHAQHEIELVGQWAAQLLRKNPEVTIGCIVPDLLSRRQDLSTIFLQTFVPHHVLPGTLPREMLFNISGGNQFHTLPMINTALELLYNKKSPLEFSLFSKMIRSHYINNAPQDAAIAAHWETIWRKKEFFKLNVVETIASLEELQSYFPNSSWGIRWKSWVEKDSPDGLAWPSHWVKQFVIELNLIGWPGQRSLTSEEYQWLSRWQQLLHEIAALDHVIGPQSRLHMLRVLKQLASQILFQIQSAANAPIQILGLLESSGLQFDHLWVMGLDEENWPPAPSPNPLLPLSLQRRYDMPHASSQREYAYTQKTQTRLTHCAKHIVLSSALQHGEQKLSPSHLIRCYPEVSPQTLVPLQPFNLMRWVYHSQDLETFYDTQGPEVTHTEKIRGGSSILQYQTNCPFKAYAKIRLNAHALKAPQIGFNAAKRGKLVHHALELFWKKLRHSEELHVYSNDALNALIETIVASTLQQEKEQSLFMHVEHIQLRKIIKAWLDFEKTRNPFSVTACEHKNRLQVGPLTIQLKIDRVDQHSEGFFVTDYKTKPAHRLANWFGDRLKDIQLPLYASYSPWPLIGMAYAHVHLQQLGWKGLQWAPQDHLTPKITPLSSCNKFLEDINSWSTLQRYWKKHLEKLAQDFYLGMAAVDPIDPSQTCRLCDLKPLCRLQTSKKYL